MGEGQEPLIRARQTIIPNLSGCVFCELVVSQLALVPGYFAFDMV